MIELVIGSNFGSLINFGSNDFIFQFLLIFISFIYPFMNFDCISEIPLISFDL